jgi:anti-sigma B factor antagonist
MGSVASGQPDYGMPGPRKITVDGFEVVARSSGEDLDVALVGELDMTACFAVEAEIERLLGDRAARRLVLDLAELDFVDSAGLGALLTIRDRTQDLGVELRLVNPSRPVRRILEATGTLPALLSDPSRGGSGV